ncbi:hypothetical protein EP331_01115 [bacterium]|nr:MAG: hypothetical protein EP331_01115 [bacterium]
MNNTLKTLFPTYSNDLSDALKNALQHDYERTDRFMLRIQVVLMILISTFGAYSSGQFLFTGFSMGLTTAITFLAYSFFKGSALSRSIMASAFMVDSAILIQINGGLIEMHFLIFVLLAVLILYKDILPLVVATVVVYVHHLGFSFLQGIDYRVFDTPIMIFNYGCGFGIVMLHAIFVIGELIAGAFIVIRLTRQFMRISDLEDIVDSLNSISDETRQAASELSVTSNTIAEGASKSSDSLNHIKFRLNEILESVKTYSQTTKGAGEMTNKASASVHMLNEALQEINNSSKNISGIIKTIDGIAFQTNILSLNAAVEAARAGEAGKGFAVVSEEVRNLSQLTSNAALDIEQKITANIKRTESVEHLLEELVSIFEDLQVGINNVEQISQNQQIKIKEIHSKTMEIDQITLSNSVMSVQHKESAKELLEQVDRQQDVVNQLTYKFRIN